MYKVMIVEDEDILRAGLIYEVPWMEYGCNAVLEASDGQEAIDVILDQKPDIVVIDINIPIKNGLQVLKETLGKHYFASIILSGYSSFEYAQSAINYNVSSYLTKPVDYSELAKAIEKAKRLLKERNFLEGSNSKSNKLKNIKLVDLDKKNRDVPDVVNEMLEYIENNFQNKISMEMLSKDLYFSQTYLSKKFKEAMGETVNNFLNKYRIQKAIDFIKENKSISISELSYKCGINNYKYFNMVFKKYVGVSITDYMSCIKKK